MNDMDNKADNVQKGMIMKNMHNRILNTKAPGYWEMRDKMKAYFSNNIYKVPSKEDLEYCFGNKYQQQKDISYIDEVLHIFNNRYKIEYKVGEIINNKFNENDWFKFKSVVITIQGITNE